MADTTVSSDDDYIIVIGDGESTPAGHQFRIVQYGESVAVFVQDDGVMEFGGKIIHDDASVAIRVANTDSSSTYVARFLRGSGKTTQLAVREDGRSDFRDGELVLRNETTASAPPNTADGDVYCYKNSGTWWLSVRVGGSWSSLEAVS